ncbi:transcription factor HIVEP2a [Rhincodon typus]|uniref:transcription factor HIVEP2a n=1 Tax=Rhincodon typus TaxID=259920 RepID=UPI00202DDD62|nr:transcription factor HIVEP2a [Rhincodon typus]
MAVQPTERQRKGKEAERERGRDSEGEEHRTDTETKEKTGQRDSEGVKEKAGGKLPPKKKRLRLAELEYSSGESSLESGTLSRSLSQDSNWSHSSSFSLSLERDEGPKPGASGRLETAEYLTVPYAVNSLGLLCQQQQQQQKEMRRSASEQAPCQPYMEMVEIRSKSFDYGNLSGGPGGALPRGPGPTSPAVRERRRCFLVRQASLGQYSENSQLEHGQEQAEPMQVSSHQVCGPAIPGRGPRHRPPSPTDRPGDAPYPLDFHQPWQLYQLPHPPPFPAPSSDPCILPWPAAPLQPAAPLPPANPGEAYPGQPADRRPQARPGWGDKDPTCPSPRASPQHSPSRRARFPPERAPAPCTGRPPPSLLVPVRIQANVPTYGSVMYTSVSHAPGPRGPADPNAIVICKVEERSTGAGQEQSRGAGRAVPLHCPQWGLPPSVVTGAAGEPSVPLTLSLVSSDGGSPIGGSKRMLSPASSLELSVETKQQKRIKEEKICGQMLEKLSLRESGAPPPAAPQGGTKSAKPQLVRQFCTTEMKEGQLLSSSSSPGSLQRHGLQSLESIPSEDRALLSHCSDMESVESFDAESPQRAPLSPGDSPSELPAPPQKFPISMLLQVPTSQGGTVVGGTILLSDAADLQQFLQFPSLRTSTSVSWCFLNYTKPNPTRHTASKLSMYDTWCISSYNPNPPGTATKVALALLRSKQKAAREIYIMSALNWPSSGKLVASSSWKQSIAQMKWYESSQCDHDGAGGKAAGSFEKEREKMETSANKDHSDKQVEPTRIKIFDGGYKSNEDYVYVRGRGRGKYICEECGIRCKKPSMLKKHIRTHTDLRPFMCKFCNFAFKTKGNLTKHMKSKAHTKKCLELGIAVTCTYNTDTEETGIPEEPEKDALSDVPVRHQFSDPEESDGAEEEGDEDDDDEDDDDEDRQGDSTPTTRSRSTSPLSKPSSSTFGITSSSAFDVSHSSNQSSLISYLVTLPRIQATQFMPPSYSHTGTPLTDYPRNLQSRLAESIEHKDRLDIPTPPNVWLPRTSDDASSRDDSSREMSPSGDTGSSAHPSPAYDGSPGSDPSPTPRRYLSPRRELSPRRHLSPRREISPIRHRSPKRDTYLSEFSLRRDASPRRPFLQRREIQLPRQLSPVKDLSPRRELSPRRDYRDRRHMPLVRATSPRRGCLQSGPIAGPYMQHSDMSLRTSHQNPLDNSRMIPWQSYPVCENAKGDQGHAILPNGPHGCLFSHLPLHSQQQVRTPYQMIPIGGIQMVHSGAVPLPGLLPASQLPLGARRRDDSVIDEATHCVIESIKEMDIFSKSEDAQVASPMAVSPPRPTSPTDPLGAEMGGGPCEEGVRGRMVEQRTLRGPSATSSGYGEHPAPTGRGGEDLQPPAEDGERAGRAGCPPAGWAWGISASPP